MSISDPVNVALHILTISHIPAIASRLQLYLIITALSASSLLILVTSSTGMESSRSPLLCLPREIRDLIYHHLLFSTSSSPPSTPPPLEAFERYQSTTSWWGIHRYAPLQPLPNTHALLQTCRQLRAETRDAIHLATSSQSCTNEGWHWHGYSSSSLHPQRGTDSPNLLKHHDASSPSALTYDLDVILLSERHLLPSWTRLPYIPPSSHPHFPHLRVTFRIFGDRDGKDSAWHTAPQSQSASIATTLGDMYFALLDLLLTFLERGPDFSLPPKAMSDRAALSIGLLDLIVETPPMERRPRMKVATPDGEYKEVEAPFIYDEQDGKRFGMISPEYVAEGVELGVHVVLGTSEYAEQVLPRVGRVRLMLDQTVRYEWDVGEMRRRKELENEDEDDGEPVLMW